MKRTTFLTPLLFASLLFLSSSCAVNPVTGKKQVVLMSEAQEISIGQQSDPEISAFFGVYDDPELQKFITQKGLEMAAVSHRPKLDYHFKVVDSPVINAFAVPGGYVYFTRGIMAHFNNEAEFAGVLGHEIGHVTARHSVVQQRNQMLGQLGMIAGMVFVPELAQFAEGMQLALMSFGRDAERQSDELGVEYSSRIGYDATEMAGFFNTLERQGAKQGASDIPEFLSTHPSPAERNVTVAKLAEQWKAKLKLTNPEVNRDSYLKLIEGIVIGEDPKQGFVENNIFYHPVLKFQFPTPQDWNFQNSPQQVQMGPKAGDALLSFSFAGTGTLEEIAQKILTQFKLELVDSKKETINGLPAFLIEFGGNTYHILGVTALANFPKYQPVFLFTARNFKELKDAEKLGRKPDVVRLFTVPQRMSFEAALRSAKMPTERFDEIAILNGMLVTDQLEKGTLIKIIAK
jgi:predicted Zn-dependent protease